MRAVRMSAAALVALLGAAPMPGTAQDSLIMQELDRRQEHLLRELDARRRRQDQRRELEREADRREDVRREDMRREDMRRSDLRREQEREEERRRQADEEARRARNR